MVLIFIINGEAVVRHWCESVESSLMKLLSAPKKKKMLLVDGLREYRL